MVNEHLRLTQDEFLRRCKQTHGDQYDYSKATYINYSTKVIVVCKTCGLEFHQLPAGHYGGNGCPRCRFAQAGKKKIQKLADSFAAKAKAIHGDKYDYTNTKYINARTTVHIYCNRCRKFFEKIPYDHLKGQGCQECTLIDMGNRRSMTTDQFIVQARNVHNDRYDYSKSVYTRSDQKVTIICPIHGEFRQSPNGHLAGHGCVKCRFRNTTTVMTEARLRTIEKARQSLAGRENPLKFTTEKFIQDCIKVHGAKYDYSKVEYKTAKDKVTIICRTHGEFEQSPDAHKRGVGCPKCSISKGESAVAKCLESLGIYYEQEKKFPECKDKRPLQFDFYFLHQGVQFLVEYHGIQHSKPIPFFESKLKHEWYVKHDQMKREFAKKFGFVMIEIWHTEQDIASFLVSEINKHITAPLHCNYTMQLKLID